MSPKIRLISIQRDYRYAGVCTIPLVECPICQHRWSMFRGEYNKAIRECPGCGYRG